MLKLSFIEDFFLSKKNKKQKIQKPIFITGLARSGSTILTHIINNHPHIGSFLYKDLPFIQIPYLWNLINNAFYNKLEDKKRPHGDNLLVGPNSPDAFDEIFFRKNIKNYLNSNSQYLSKSYKNIGLEKGIKNTISKILYIRGDKKRYLSKNNYNITRIEYLLSIFPNARIIICIRNPVETAKSLVRVHQRFNNFCKENKYVEDQLKTLSHFEFGPQRKPIRLKHNIYNKIIENWKKGNEYEGYLLQWIDIYSVVLNKYLLNKKISKKIIVLDNNELKTNPKKMIEKTAKFLELEKNKLFLKKAFKLIKKKNTKNEINVSYKKNLEKKAISIYKKILRK